jgi:2-dehydropantoate 2-reductase
MSSSRKPEDQETPPLQFMVLGAGAIGSAFAGFLALAGERVTLYGRGSHLEEIRRNGLSLDGIWGQHQSISVNTLFPGENSDFIPDAILLAVKAFDTESAIEDAQKLCNNDPLVVSLQNGLGNCELISRRIGSSRTVGGRVIFGVTIPKAGHATITVCADDVKLGPVEDGPPMEIVERIAQSINSSGIPCTPTSRIDAYIWGKALYNCALNPLSALLRCPYGELGEHAETRDLMRTAIDEIYAVANARGISMLRPDSDSYWGHFTNNELPATRAHRSSMLQAIEAGKITEIDALSGAIVRMGQEHNVPTPVNQMLWQLVSVLEKT